MLVGKSLGPFVVDKELGAGAMGAVFRGKHGESGQIVAIKIIAPGLTSNEMALKRFEREIAILKQLKHTNIVRIVASGRYQKTPFYVMEYIEGESLDHVMARRGRLTWEEVVTLGRQLCAALAHAHLKGIVHRDLKPSNLMILKDGTLKLTDFGIAKDTEDVGLTRTNATVGTAAYMSPEQCRGDKNITYKSDLYSLGIMFYELLTGRKPLHADNIRDMFQAHITGTFERPSRLVLEIPIWLDTLICQLMEKDPAKRPLNADLVAEGLDYVKERVLQQQSAGVEAAKKRKADRSTLDVALDETDKDVARTLIGKKKKKKRIPIYRQGWFTLASVVGVLGLVGLCLYFFVFKAESAASLYDRARMGIRSANTEERREARDGPVTDFLTLYPEDTKAAEVRQWADQYDLERAETQMYNRLRGKLNPQLDAHDLTARDALDAEDDGKLDKANESWQKLASLSKSTDVDAHAWGLVGQKHVADLKAVKDLSVTLKKRILDDMDAGKVTEGVGDEEKLAVAGFRAEMDKKWDLAKQNWQDLKKLVEDDAAKRTWYLLSVQHQREAVLQLKADK